MDRIIINSSNGASTTIERETIDEIILNNVAIYTSRMGKIAQCNHVFSAPEKLIVTCNKCEEKFMCV
jgi:hypothetical protein